MSSSFLRGAKIWKKKQRNKSKTNSESIFLTSKIKSSRTQEYILRSYKKTNIS
jgi:hypothetical protein